MIDDYKLEKSVGELLMENNFTVATAESCTGGLVASRLTDFAGASNYVKGGVVAYTNEIKKSVLRVNAETLENFGAVSSQTALEMAKNVREIFKSTFGLSTTGVAGPSTSEGKAVGTVFVAIAGENFSEVKEFHFTGSRSEIKFQAADAAFELLMKYTALT
ncbi:MAG: CinA family protein [Selenomonadaceae bacterium]|nr:CinA family protein [Selenomonadaceae bacterium]